MTIESNKKDFEIIGESPDKYGNRIAVDVKYSLEDEFYIIPFATTEFIQQLRAYNTQFPEGQGLDESYIVLPSLDDPNITARIRSFTAEDLQPFIQNKDTEQTGNQKNNL